MRKNIKSWIRTDTKMTLINTITGLYPGRCTYCKADKSLRKPFCPKCLKLFKRRSGTNFDREEGMRIQNAMMKRQISRRQFITMRDNFLDAIENQSSFSIETLKRKWL